MSADNLLASSPELALPNQELSNAFGAGPVIAQLDVSISNEVVHLLSEQLYTSPLKAIEEIVVNAYDADATECRIGLLLGDATQDGSNNILDPVLYNSGADEDVIDSITVADENVIAPRGIIAIFDDGDGMSLDGLRGLWRVGDSPKRNFAGPTKRFGRKVVGKFGIGKLATYAVAHRITYVTANAGKIYHVVCDFKRFAPQADGNQPVHLEVREVDNLKNLLARSDMASVMQKLDLVVARLTTGSTPSWTLCILAELKPKARDLKIGRLGWVLRTAMPLKSGFSVYLNGTKQTSSKEDQEKVVEFKTGDLQPERLISLNKKLGIALSRSGEILVEPNLFPSGIRGHAFVTEGTLVGKSDALMGRSHGFFVRVRDRVVNLDDSLFHNTPISHGTFNRFRADLDIDDLGAAIK